MPVFKGTRSFYDYDVSDYVEYNLQAWLSYGLLEVGAFTNIQFSNPGTSGYTTLQSIHDERYINGQVYEGLGPGWVWEKDVVPNGSGILPPFQASGVYVNNTFYPTATTTGSYSHIIDFQNARVVFNAAVTGLVQAEYSMRDVAVYVSDSPNWKTIVEQYTQVYPTIANTSPSGMSELLKQNRVWLPAVVIEIENRDSTGLQLGGGDYNTFDVAFHTFADRPATSRRLVDLLNNQFETSINLFDVNSITFPYNYDGTLISGALTYPVLSNRNANTFWTYARVLGTSGGTKNSNTDVYRGENDFRLEVQRVLSTF